MAPFSYWACPRGHRWETSEPTTESAFCPVCGEPGQGDPRTQYNGDDVPTIGAPPPLSSKNFGSEIRVEGYEILGELGRGGMGVVYKARQAGLNRLVALKMILAAEHAGADQVERFRAEAQAVAQLIHPNIVQVYEVGDADGRPYFSLEYVDGGTLAQKLNGQPQPCRPSAVLIEAIARAMHAAHERGIVHRDLKPANVLLAACCSMDSSSGSTVIRAEFPLGLPKVTDFGLAKRIGSDGNTATGAVLGTPSYMSPEQAAGRGKEVGPLTDVYALGAILYEMLTGRPPFRAESPMETLMQVVRDEPIPPSHLRPKLPRDLEVICLKCLRKQPKHRYQSAQDLADDLRRYLNGEPIAARPATLLDRTRHWVRRRPVLAAALGVALIGGIIIAIEAVTYHRKLHRALEQTEQERNRASEQHREAQRRLVRLAVANGERHLTDGDLLGALPWFAEALRLEEGDPVREEMHRIRLAAVLRHAPRLVKVRFHEGSVYDAAFCPSGQLIISGGDDGFAIIESLHDTDFQQTTHLGVIQKLAFRHDAAWFLTLGEDHSVNVWDSATGKAIGAPLTHREAVTTARFSPDGRHVMTACRDRAVRIWDPVTSQLVRPVLTSETPVTAAAYSPNGQLAVIATEAGVARVWDLARGEPVSAPMTHSKAIRHVAFSPDGKWVLTAGDDGLAKLWEATGIGSAGEATTMRHMRKINSARFSPDGQRIVTASDDGSARVWNTADGMAVTPALKHSSFVHGAEFSPDGRWIVTAGDDNIARVWDAATGDPVLAPLKHNGTVFRATFSRDGRHVLTASQDGMARVWEVALAPRRAAAPFTAKPGRVLSPDGHLQLEFDVDGTVRVLDSSTGQPIGEALHLHVAQVRYAVFTADGQRVLTAGEDRIAQVWDMATRRPLGRTLRHGSAVLHGAFSPDGQRVITASADNTARVWDANSGEPLSPPLKHQSSVQRVAFSPDGKAVLTASRDGTARLWDAVTGEALSPPLTGVSWVRDALESSTAAGWDMPPDRRPVEQLIRLAQWLSGQRVDATGGMVPLDPLDLRYLWDQMQKEQSGDLELPADQRLSWHRQEAERCEASGDWFAAAFHLAELLNATPQDVSLRIRRGKALAERGDWPAAREDFAAALAAGADGVDIYIAAALAHLGAGDRSGYLRICRELLNRHGKLAFGETAHRLAWTCLLVDDPEIATAALTITKTASRYHASAQSDSCRGAALFRTGKTTDAVRLLTEGQALTDAGEIVRSWLFLGMVLATNDRTDEARELLKRASRWLTQQAETGSPPLTWMQRLELTLLHQEAQRKLAGES